MELSKEFGKIYYIYDVIEKYDDGFTEAFGFVKLDHTPAVGETLFLVWLDGSSAYKVSLLEVRHDSKLLVKRLEGQIGEAGVR